MNMTKVGEHDQKIDNDERYLFNMTENLKYFWSCSKGNICRCQFSVMLMDFIFIQSSLFGQVNVKTFKLSLNKPSQKYQVKLFCQSNTSTIVLLLSTVEKTCHFLSCLHVNTFFYQNEG